MEIYVTEVPVKYLPCFFDFEPSAFAKYYQKWMYLPMIIIKKFKKMIGGYELEVCNS